MDQTDYERAIDKVGGAFRLTVLLQKRVRELVRGSQPLIDAGTQESPIDIALKEVLSDKVAVSAGDRVGVLSIEQAVAATERAEGAEGKDEGDEDAKKKAKKRAKK